MIGLLGQTKEIHPFLVHGKLGCELQLSGSISKDCPIWEPPIPHHHHNNNNNSNILFNNNSNSNSNIIFSIINLIMARGCRIYLGHFHPMSDNYSKGKKQYRV